jgi:hypothetical protein
MKDTNEKLIQWHPAFYAGIQIELQEYADKLLFENEHQITSKPLAADVMIIKLIEELQIEKNIGRIFKSYNIIEYKGPDDYVSIDDYYKITACAYLYKIDVAMTDSIKIEDITISIVCVHYPRKLVNHLRDVYGYKVERVDSGIYYILKDNGILPTQLIVTSELDYETNMWIAGLTNDMNDSEKADKLLKEYKAHKDNTLYESVMNVVVRANNELFNGGDVMCEALDELYKDAIDARVNELSDKKAEEMAKNMAKNMANEMAKNMANEMAENMAKNMAKDIAKDMAKDMAKDIVASKDEELATKDDELAVLRAQVAELQKRIAQQ